MSKLQCPKCKNLEDGHLAIDAWADDALVYYLDENGEVCDEKSYGGDSWRLPGGESRCTMCQYEGAFEEFVTPGNDPEEVYPSNHSKYYINEVSISVLASHVFDRIWMKLMRPIWSFKLWLRRARNEYN